MKADMDVHVQALSYTDQFSQYWNSMYAVCSEALESEKAIIGASAHTEVTMPNCSGQFSAPSPYTVIKVAA